MGHPVWEKILLLYCLLDAKTEDEWFLHGLLHKYKAIWS